MASIASYAWGGNEQEITQGFGPGFRPDWYAYSANYGYPAGYHIGLDIGVPKGTPIRALNAGVVSHAGWSDSFRPNPVYVITKDDPATPTDEGGYEEIYGHLWQASVQTGQTVQKGDLLGYSGEQTLIGTMQPDTSGPHLHFELRDECSGESDCPPSGYRAQNPTEWLKIGGKFVPGSAPPMNSDGTPNPSGGDSSGIMEKLSNYAARGVLVMIGTLVLMFGLIQISSNGAFSGGFRKARKAVIRV